MSESWDSTARKVVTLGVLTWVTFSIGCRSTLPVASSELATALMTEANSTVETVNKKAQNSPIYGVRIEIGDALHLISPGDGSGYHFRVQKDGTITIPTLGTFVAAGKTMNELYTEFLRKEARYRNYGLSHCCCDFTYTVMGEVKAPGTKQYAGPTTVSQAILAAGGFTKSANTRIVKVVHNGRSETIRLSGKAPAENRDPPVFMGYIIMVKRCGLFATWP